LIIGASGAEAALHWASPQRLNICRTHRVCEPLRALNAGPRGNKREECFDPCLSGVGSGPRPIPGSWPGLRWPSGLTAWFAIQRGLSIIGTSIRICSQRGVRMLGSISVSSRGDVRHNHQKADECERQEQHQDAECNVMNVHVSLLVLRQSATAAAIPK